MKGQVGTPYYDREKNQFFSAYGRQRKVAPEARELYSYLYDNANDLKRMEEIMDFVFGEENHNIDKLYVYISRLNKIIAQHQDTRIYNKRKVGYKLVIPAKDIVNVVGK